MNGSNEKRGFTKLDDGPVDDLGLVPAAVLGAVLRYSRMSEGICRASVRSIARRVHLCESAVHRALRRLVREGYLQDLTPGLRNVPHTYRGTGKAVADSREEQDASVLHENVAVLEKNATVLQENASVLVVPMKRVLRHQEETREEINPRGAAAPQPAAAAELRVFAEAAGFLPRKQTFDDVIAAVRQIGRRLRRETQPDDLKRFIGAWVGRGWNPYNLNWLYEWAVKGEIPEPERRQNERKVEHGNILLGSGTAHQKREELSPAERERLSQCYNRHRKP